MPAQVLVRYPDGNREIHVAWTTPQAGEHFPAPGWVVERVAQFSGGIHDGVMYEYEVQVMLETPQER